MGIEREIKLSAWAGFALPDLSGAIEGLTETTMSPVQLTATYYDTPDLRLTRSGLSLRHRFGGGESGWTVKLPDGTDGPALVRRELNFDGGAAAVPDAARSLVRAYVRNSELVPVAKLVTRRQQTTNRARHVPSLACLPQMLRGCFRIAEPIGWRAHRSRIAVLRRGILSQRHPAVAEPL